MSIERASVNYIFLPIGKKIIGLRKMTVIDEEPWPKYAEIYTYL